MGLAASAQKSETSTNKQSSSATAPGMSGLAMAPPMYGIDWVDGFPLQKKLAVGGPGDACEREADAVARSVMSREAVGPGASFLRGQPSTGPISLRAPTRIQRSGSAPRSTVSPEIEDGIRRMRRGGEPLSPAVGASMGAAFGMDFGHIRIHTDSHASRMSRALGARAFTIGNDIAFDSGQYQPHTPFGRALLSHELTHTIQQGGGGEESGGEVIQRWPWDDWNIDINFAQIWEDIKSVAQGAIDTAANLLREARELWERTKRVLESAFETVKTAVMAAKSAIEIAVSKAFQWVNDIVEWGKEVLKLVEYFRNGVEILKNLLLDAFKDPLGAGRGYALSLGGEFTLFSVNVKANTKEDAQHTHDGKLKLTKILTPSVGLDFGVGGSAGIAKAEASAAVGLSTIMKEVFEFPYDEVMDNLGALIVAVLPISTTPIGMIVRSVLPDVINPNRYSKEKGLELQQAFNASAGVGSAGLGGKTSKGRTSKAKAAGGTSAKGGQSEGSTASLLKNPVSADASAYMSVAVAEVKETTNGQEQKLWRVTLKAGGSAGLELLHLLETVGLDSVVKEIKRVTGMKELKVAGEISVSLYINPQGVMTLISAESIQRLLDDPYEWLLTFVGEDLGTILRRVELQGRSMPEDEPIATTVGEGTDITATIYPNALSARAPTNLGDVEEIAKAVVPDSLTIARRVEPEGEATHLFGNQAFKQVMDGLKSVPILTQSETLLLLEIELKKAFLAKLLARALQSNMRTPEDGLVAAANTWAALADFFVRGRLPKELEPGTLIDTLEEQKNASDKTVELKKAVLRVLGGLKASPEGEMKAGVSFSVGLSIDLSAYHDTNLLTADMEKDVLKNLRTILALDVSKKTVQKPLRSVPLSEVMTRNATYMQIGDAWVFLQLSSVRKPQRAGVYTTSQYTSPGTGSVEKEQGKNVFKVQIPASKQVNGQPSLDPTAVYSEVGNSGPAPGSKAVVPAGAKELSGKPK